MLNKLRTAFFRFLRMETLDDVETLFFIVALGSALVLQIMFLVYILS